MRDNLSYLNEAGEKKPDFRRFEIPHPPVVKAVSQGQTMTQPRPSLSTFDPIWTALRQQAEAMAEREPALAGFIHATILQHERFEQALSYHLARKLGGEDLGPLAIREM